MNRKGASLGLVVGSLGVVYGDIGTSPLYTMSEAFFGHYPLARTPENVLGVVSLVFWSLMLVVTIKYVTLVMRADNDGEGGIFAMLGLLLKHERSRESAGHGGFSPRFRALLLGLILVGAGLLYGDGMITPAISVLSAVEGLRVVAPSAGQVVVPATLLILVALFAVQKKGTHRIGWLFGPVMALWFLTIALLGLAEVIRTPGILAGLNPWYALALAQEHGGRVLLILGTVVLCVTGVEAMYADLGHFGRPVINRSWLFIVFPCLVLNYAGQGAHMLSGDAVPNHHLFYAIAPAPLLIPMVVLATVATVIASQALISGAFSLTQQAIALGLFPRSRIVHTNPDMPGQIYVPSINWLLLVGCVALVVAFKTSGALAAAYGLAVTGTMVVTTGVFLVIAARVFRWRWQCLVPVMVPILALDLAFFGANLLKFLAGGWVPVLIGFLVFATMDTWRWGRQWIGRLYQERLKEFRLPVRKLLEHKTELADPRSSISLVVMASRPITSLDDAVPPVMAVHFRNWRRLPRHIVFFSVVQTGSPWVKEEERCHVTAFAEGEHGTVVSVQAHYGYMEQPNVREALRTLKERGRIRIPQQAGRWLILIGLERFITPGRNVLERLRIGIFSRLNRLAKPVTDYFGLETDAAVVMESINV